MFKTKITLVGLLAPVLMSAQSFTGTIGFKYFTTKYTTINIYKLKEKYLKLEHFDKKTCVF